MNTEPETLSTEEKNDIYLVPIEVDPIIKDFLEEICPDEKIRLEFLSAHLRARLSLYQVIFSTLYLIGKETLKTDWKKREILLKYAKICEEMDSTVLFMEKRVRNYLVGILKE